MSRSQWYSELSALGRVLEGALGDTRSGATIGSAIAGTAYGCYGGPYYPSYGYYPGYGGYGYYRSGPWPAMQEPGLARFYGPRRFGWGYW